MSLAIGKRGQNVRLASQLTGWKIDIVSETEMAKRVANAKYQLMLIPGVTDTLAMALYQNGFETVRDVAGAEADMFVDVPGFDQAKGADLIEKAKEVVASGKADQMPAPAELPGVDLSTLGGAPTADSIEAKLRAELAAREKSK